MVLETNQEISKVLTTVTNGQNSLKDEEKIRQEISKSGLIDKLTTQLKTIQETKSVKPIETVVATKRQRTLNLTITKGRALVGLNTIEDPGSTIRIHLSFGQIRRSSQPILSEIEPKIDYNTSFALPSKELNLLLDIEYPIHVVLTRKDINGNISTIGIANIEWRSVLHAGRSSLLVELKEPAQPDITAGILDIVLDLPSEELYLRKDQVDFYLNSKDQTRKDAESSFFANAKIWWNDYLQIRAANATRLVKIFANNEMGTRAPVNFGLYPIVCRVLETPRHALRFVSLIDTVSFSRVGDIRNMEIWQSVHTFLASGRGDIQDHCILLCNLLLGFNLDAYVTMGTDDKNNSHIWVTTIDTQGVVTFWETTTGATFNQKEKHHYRTIGCCFNAKNLYANIQVRDAADSVNFNLNDISSWKLLPMLRPSRQLSFSLCALQMDVPNTELELESELHQIIEFYRTDRHMTCVWDESLAHLLGQSLWNLEHEKLSGRNSSAFTIDFQTGIKRAMPELHVFKGFPICFNHCNGQKIFSMMARTKQCRDILTTRGDCVRMAVRVKIFPYCDNVMACWVLIGSRSLP